MHSDNKKPSGLHEEGEPFSQALRISREAFAKISAVEGITLSEDMKAAFEDFDQRKLSPAKRRAEIISRFRREAAE